MPPINKSEQKNTDLARIQWDIGKILLDLDLIKIDMKSRFASVTEMQQLRIEITELRSQIVTHDQFWPIKTAVYGAVGLILMGAVGSILALVYRSHS